MNSTIRAIMIAVVMLMGIFIGVAEIAKYGARPHPLGVTFTPESQVVTPESDNLVGWWYGPERNRDFQFHRVELDDGSICILALDGGGYYLGLSCNFNLQERH